MRPDRYTQGSCYAFGAALALAASTALADTSTAQQPVPESSVKSSTAPYVYASSEAGLRRAAAQGPVALHLYIYRTRMIYNYYFWDFAKEE